MGFDLLPPPPTEAKHLRLARTHCSRTEWLNYKKYSAKLRKHIKQASRRFWDTLCQDSCSNQKIFKILKRLSNRNLNTGDNILRNPDPIIHVNSQANAFLQHFSKDNPGQPIPYDLSDADPALDVPFTLDELQFALRQARPTTPGADGISIQLLKQLSTNHLLSLLSTFNNIYNSGTLPPSWKLASIIPICKPGKPPHQTSSYRPIALTSACCKLLERMLLRRLLAWGGRRNLFNENFYGFIPSRDCTTALATLLHDLSTARASNLFAAMVSLDIKAAYDSVCLDILIYKIATYGIRGKAGRWIENFSKFRLIQILWKLFLSHSAPCFQRVPQGSVLSPLLFLL